MEIRLAEENDIEALVENRMEFIYSIKSIYPPESFKDLTREYMKENLNNGSLAAWIAVNEKKIVSACILCVTQQVPMPISINGKIGYVYNVYTIPEYRRQGLAKKLLEQLTEYAIENGITSIQLSATDDGFELYKNLGFVQLKNEMRLSFQKCPIS